MTIWILVAAIILVFVCRFNLLWGVWLKKLDQHLEMDLWFWHDMSHAANLHLILFLPFFFTMYYTTWFFCPTAFGRL